MSDKIKVNDEKIISDKPKKIKIKKYEIEKEYILLCECVKCGLALYCDKNRKAKPKKFICNCGNVFSEV